MDILSDVQYYTLMHNAFPNRMEQEEFYSSIANSYPNVENMQLLSMRVHHEIEL